MDMSVSLLRTFAAEGDSTGEEASIFAIIIK